MICMTCAANCYFDLLDKLQKQVYRAVGSKIAASLPLNGNQPKPFFSMWVFFQEHSQITGQQGKGRAFH